MGRHAQLAADTDAPLALLHDLRSEALSLASIVSLGEGILPLDPTLGGALKALIAKGNLWGYFKKGGPIMWPLLALAVLALSVIFERLMFLALEKGRRSHKTVAAIMGALEKGNPDEAIRAGLKSKDFVARAEDKACRVDSCLSCSPASFFGAARNQVIDHRTSTDQLLAEMPCERGVATNVSPGHARPRRARSHASASIKFKNEQRLTDD